MDSLQECEQLQKMYGGHMDERTLEKTQQQHMLYQQEQHHQILHQQIQVLEPEPGLLKSVFSCVAADTTTEQVPVGLGRVDCSACCNEKPEGLQQ